MAKLTVKLPDDSALELDQGATGADAAAAIGPRLAKDALAVRVNGEVRDLAAPLADGERIEILTPGPAEALQVLRHDCAHVLATAVLDLWPGTKVSIGPPIERGFYYDFEFPDGFRPSEADLERIEERMAAHIQADEPFERSEISADEAIQRFRAEQQPYKVELIEDLKRDEGVETVSLYRNGPFVDLCRGPHGPSTGRIKAFKLSSVAGAYWRGDESRQMLTRIYGTAFFSKKELEEHLERLEQARARDHRRLGPQLGLFMLLRRRPGCRSGCPEGTVLLRLIEREVRGQLERGGYVEIKTPQVLDEELWRRSGHWDNYAENMFFTEARRTRRFALKPMNCPGACLVYASERRSYRDLPLRLAEFGLVLAQRARGGAARPAARPRLHPGRRARLLHARPGNRRGRLDLRGDRRAVRAVRLRPRCGSSSRPGPTSRIGTDEQWERAEGALREALERQGREYEVSPGEGTFYGPKIDFHITDALGRSWQCGTCQLDFQMPERFDLTYQGADNAEHRPVMIHRALLGLDGALRGHPDRASRGPLPGLAGSDPGRDPAGCRPSPGLCARGGGAAE